MGGGWLDQLKIRLTSAMAFFELGLGLSLAIILVALFLYFSFGYGSSLKKGFSLVYFVFIFL